MPYFIIFIASLSISCTYRFSNLRPLPQEGAESISIEGIYDTSGQSLPHEHLWLELQKAFANTGSIRLTSHERADLYLRVHLFDASVTPTNSSSLSVKDLPSISGEPPMWTSFTPLNRALKYSTKDLLTFSVKVEIWRINTNEAAKRIFSKDYTMSEKYPMIDLETTQDNQFLRAQEAQENIFKKLAGNLSDKIVDDFL